jgi:hypothetical protein
MLNLAADIDRDIISLCKNYKKIGCLYSLPDSKITISNRYPKEAFPSIIKSASKEKQT